MPPKRSESIDNIAREASLQIKKHVHRFGIFVIGIAIVIHTSLLTLAVIYIDDCPVDPAIPICLLLISAFGIFIKILIILIYYIKLNAKTKSKIFVVTSLIELTLLIWGSYHTFKEFHPNYFSDSGDKYCHIAVYVTTFVFLISAWIFLLLFSLLICSIYIILFYKLVSLLPRESDV